MPTTDRKIAVLIPSRDRPKELAEAVESVKVTAPSADVIAYVDDDQKDLYGAVEMPGLSAMICGPRVGPVSAANSLVESRPGYDVYGLITDDARTVCPGWDRWVLEVLEALPNRIGVISPHHNQGSHVDMPFVTRRWIDVVGWYACPTCKHYCWPIITGLIGEMSSIVHAPQSEFSVHHPHKVEMVSLAKRDGDAQAFFEYVSLRLPAVVERVRQAMFP